MSVSDADRSASFYDSVAPHYDAQLRKVPGDIWTRRAFQSLVAENVRPGATLLDFGCGTGTDDLWYTSQGYRVIAYDNSSGMLNELRRKCSNEIERGQMTCHSARYADFLNDARTGTLDHLDAITANFAVLNLIYDLEPLFSAFASMLAPGGLVFASVMNPFFWNEIIHPAWWRENHIHFGARMVIFDKGAVGTYRHFIPHVDREASPGFNRVRRASVGALIRHSSVRDSWERPTSPAARLETCLWKTWPMNRLGKYIFLVYRKRI